MNFFNEKSDFFGQKNLIQTHPYIIIDWPNRFSTIIRLPDMLFWCKHTHSVFEHVQIEKKKLISGFKMRYDAK